jgi:hypothetical protein
MADTTRLKPQRLLCGFKRPFNWNALNDWTWSNPGNEIVGTLPTFRRTPD